MSGCAGLDQKVFVVGLPRSGTSTLIHSLRSVGFGGFAEGHLLGLLPTLEEAIAKYYTTWSHEKVPDTMLNQMDVSELILRYRAFFRGIAEELIGPPPWCDKNALPSIFPYLDVVQSVWPEGYFIFMKRRPVDFIVSALKKFPDRSFEQLCEVIRFTMQNWEVQKVHLQKYLEVDQSEFYDAFALARKLIGFLNLPETFLDTVSENLGLQIERTSESYAPKHLDELNLTDRQRQIFEEKCGHITRLYG